MPSKRIEPPAMRPGGCGTRPMIDSAVTLLPQPDSPTMPSVRPASTVKLDAVDRGELAVVGREVGAQVAHLEQRVMRHRRSGGRPCALTRAARPLALARKRSMRASISARSVTPAGSCRPGRQATNGWKRSRLLS